LGEKKSKLRVWEKVPSGNFKKARNPYHRDLGGRGEISKRERGGKKKGRKTRGMNYAEKRIHPFSSRGREPRKEGVKELSKLWEGSANSKGGGG